MIGFSGGPVVVYDREGHILSDEREHDEKVLLTEEDAIKCFIEGHNWHHLADFYCMLSEDAAYFSEWASEEKTGRADIIDYLRSKMIEVKNASNNLHAVFGKSNEKLCAAILKTGETTPIAVVFLTLSDQNKVSRVDVLKSQSEIEIIYD